MFVELLESWEPQTPGSRMQPAKILFRLTGRFSFFWHECGSTTYNMNAARMSSSYILQVIGELTWLPSRLLGAQLSGTINCAFFSLLFLLRSRLVVKPNDCSVSTVAGHRVSCFRPPSVCSYLITFWDFWTPPVLLVCGFFTELFVLLSSFHNSLVALYHLINFSLFFYFKCCHFRKLSIEFNKSIIFGIIRQNFFINN